MMHALGESVPVGVVRQRMVARMMSMSSLPSVKKVKEC